MIKIKISKSLKTGWNLFTKRPLYLLGVALSVFILFLITASNSAVLTALSYILYGGYIALLLKHYSSETVVFDDLFSGLDNRWISFAFLGLIKGLLIMVGFLFFIVPGVYLSVRWMFAELYVVDKGMRPIEALRASSKLTKGNWWKLFFFSLVIFILILIGLTLVIVGAVVASIVTTFATIYIYKTLQAQKENVPVLKKEE